MKKFFVCLFKSKILTTKERQKWARQIADKEVINDGMEVVEELGYEEEDKKIEEGEYKEEVWRMQKFIFNCKPIC